MSSCRLGAVVVVCTALVAACGASGANEIGVMAGRSAIDEKVLSGAAGPEPSTAAGSSAAPAPTGPAAATATTAAGSAPVNAAPTTVARKATTTTTSKAASTGPGASTAADLEKLMVTNAPPGYQRLNDEDEVTGAVDLEAAVDEDGEDDAEQFFRRHGFEAGWDRAWTRGEYDEDDEDAVEVKVYDTLYRWRDAGGANAHMDRVAAYVDQADEDNEVEITRFSVEGVPGAKGYAASDPEFGSGAFVVFTKGRYSVQVESSEESMDQAKQVASSIARDQYSRL